MMVKSFLMSTLMWFTLCGCAETANKAITPPAVISAAIPESAEKTFKNDVLNSKKPVLVDFYATWCGPCKLMMPIVEDVTARYSNRISAYRIDIDKNPALAAQYNVQAVPSILIFAAGKPVATSVGVVSDQTLSSSVEAVLGKK